MMLSRENANLGMDVPKSNVISQHLAQKHWPRQCDGNQHQKTELDILIPYGLLKNFLMEFKQVL